MQLMQLKNILLVKFILCVLSFILITACGEQEKHTKEEAEAKNIIFITHTNTIGGKGVYSIYKEAKKLGHNVKIVVIPSIYFGKLLADVDVNFGSNFDSEDVIYPCGKEAPYTNCDSIENYKPDYIFTQNPYDTFKGSVLEKHFLISNLQKFAKIMYIVYGPHLFHQDSINDSALPKFVDTVFVDSDSTKEIYISKYAFPENKIVVSGYQPYKDIRDMQNRVKRSARETILYLPRWLLSFKDRYLYEGGSTFLNYHYFFYNFAVQNPQIDFIIRPHILLYSHAVEGDYMSQKDLDEIFNRFRLLDNVTIASHADKPLIDDIMSSDIIISDGSSALAEAVVADKPIIYLSNGANIEFESNTLSKEFKKHVFFAYDPNDIKHYINMIRKNKYSPNFMGSENAHDRAKFKTMLDPVENPARYIAEYLLYN